MKSLWNDNEAEDLQDDPLQMRVYSSRLLGKDPSLVLHGGGNTSVKAKSKDLFGDEEDVLYVKGSGWDLATIEAAGFAAVKLEPLKRMATLDELSDSNMVKGQRVAMMDPSAPNPSVEAILHAIIPFTFVDHTHTDAMVTLTNTPEGLQIIGQVYGDKVLVIPYVMPGFDLAKMVFNMTQDIDWSELHGMVLMNHGLFSFADDAKTSYERMISLVSKAEDYLREHKALVAPEKRIAEKSVCLQQLACLRKQVSELMGRALVTLFDDSEEACGFASKKNLNEIANRGPLTPDHVIRTKRLPLVLDISALDMTVLDSSSGVESQIKTRIAETVQEYNKSYQSYFQRNNNNSSQLSCLDTAPRWGVWRDQGTLAFAKSIKEAKIIQDISRHTVKSIQWAEAIGGWQALPEADIFDVEYWELEQAKLGKGKGEPVLQGKIAMVSGAASGIGKACAQALLVHGACVVALDINPTVIELFDTPGSIGLVCDVTKTEQITDAVNHCVRAYGGLDILVNNAGLFPPSLALESMDEATWDASLAINLTSQQRLLTAATPYLKLGIDPTAIFIASKNVPAPGPGAGAYSVAKAGATQLARVAAMELGSCGVRVNTVHPNAVFDTGIWTEEVLAKRAEHYGMTVDEYKKNNILKTEINAADVAELVCAMAGPVFAKTTGAQLPIDGGNDRVI